MSQTFLRKLRSFSFTVKEAIGEKTKSLKYEVGRLGLERDIRGIYREAEDNSDRYTIVQRFLIFMAALKKANHPGYEYLRFNIDIFLNDVEVVGFPKHEPENPLEQIYIGLDSISRKLKGLLKQ